MKKLIRVYSLGTTLGAVYEIDGRRCATALPKGIDTPDLIMAYLDIEIEGGKKRTTAPALAIVSACLGLVVIGAPLAFVATLATLALALWVSSSDLAPCIGAVSNASATILTGQEDRLADKVALTT